MKRSVWTLTIVAVIGVLAALPALAAGPTVAKSVLGEADGASVVVVRVTASGHDVYGVTIKDMSASITDITAPKGWVGISSGKDVIFRTGTSPIKAGSSASFRLTTTNKDGELTVSFKDAKTIIGESKKL
jgi:hypothetical protein